MESWFCPFRTIYLSWLLLSLILSDPDRHTLGSAWSLLSSVSLSPYIWISVKVSCLFTLISLSTTNDFVWPALFQVTMVDRRSCGSDTTSWCLVLLSCLLDPYFLHIFVFIRYSVNVTCKLWFVVLLCTSEIYCMFVHPGGGIPPLWLKSFSLSNYPTGSKASNSKERKKENHSGWKNLRIEIKDLKG